MRPLPPNVLYRVGHVLALWRSMFILLGKSHGNWLRSSNPVLRGRRPVRLLVSGRERDLIALRLLLKGAINN